jgi:hypothetical protein
MRHLVILALTLVLSAILSAQDADPVRLQLAAAIRDHTAIVANARYVIAFELQSRIRALHATATPDIVQRLAAEKKAFETTGALPAWLAAAPPVKGYPETVAEADARLDAAYKNAEAAYVKAQRADLAQAVRAERQQVRLPSVSIAAVAARPPTPTPPPSIAQKAAPAIVDLLPLVDVDRDSVNASWSRGPEGLTSRAGEASGIRIHYEPPEEYDFLVEFTRNRGNDTIGQICWAYGQHFRWSVGGWGNTVSGIDELNGRQTIYNRTKVQMGIETGVRYKSVAKVRKNQVSCYLDERLITTLETDYSDLRYMRWQNDPGILGIETWHSTYTVHKITITEITGKGRKVVPTRAGSPRDRTAPQF